MSQRFFISSDDSGHDYLVPVDRREDWDRWREIPSDDERSWIVPLYAVPFETSQLTFTDPKFE